MITTGWLPIRCCGDSPDELARYSPMDRPMAAVSWNRTSSRHYNNSCLLTRNVKVEERKRSELTILPAPQYMHASCTTCSRADQQMTYKSPLNEPWRAIEHLSSRVRSVELAWLSAYPCYHDVAVQAERSCAAVEERAVKSKATAKRGRKPQVHRMGSFRLALLDLIPAPCHTSCTHCRPDKEDGRSIHPLRAAVVSDGLQPAQMTQGSTTFARLIDMSTVMR